MERTVRLTEESGAFKENKWGESEALSCSKTTRIIGGQTMEICEMTDAASKGTLYDSINHCIKSLEGYCEECEESYEPVIGRGGVSQPLLATLCIQPTQVSDKMYSFQANNWGTVHALLSI